MICFLLEAERDGTDVVAGAVVIERERVSCRKTSHARDDSLRSRKWIVIALRALKTTGTFKPRLELSSPTSQPVRLPEGPGLVVSYTIGRRLLAPRPRLHMRSGLLNLSRADECAGAGSIPVLRRRRRLRYPKCSGRISTGYGAAKISADEDKTG